MDNATPTSKKKSSKETTPETLKKIAHLAAERNQRKKKQLITIRVSPDILEKYRTMGNGYTSIMSDVLSYAVNNPAVLTPGQGQTEEAQRHA